jgi:hypothetical protein
MTHDFGTNKLVETNLAIPECFKPEFSSIKYTFYAESSRKILFLQSGKLKTHMGQNPDAIPVLPA